VASDADEHRIDKDKEGCSRAVKNPIIRHEQPSEDDEGEEESEDCECSDGEGSTENDEATKVDECKEPEGEHDRETSEESDLDGECSDEEGSAEDDDESEDDEGEPWTSRPATTRKSMHVSLVRSRA
jgi:hypothetical protein